MKIGIIGCGRQAPKHISGLRACSQTQASITSIFVADHDLARAQAFADKTAASNSGIDIQAIALADMFTRPDIDGLIIATPTKTHFDLCQSAILAGRPFLVEKPFVATRQQAEDLEALSQRHQVPGGVGFIYRFSPVFQHFKTLLSDPNTSIMDGPKTAVFEIRGRGSHTAWKHQRRHDGGIINEMMVHMVDLAIWLFGSVKTVEISEIDCIQKTRMIRDQPVDCDAEDWCIATLRMADGTTVRIQSDSVSDEFHQWADIRSPQARLEGSIQNTGRDALTVITATDNRAEGRHPLIFDPGNLYIAQAACFLSLMQGQLTPPLPTAPLCTLANATQTMRVMDALHRQARALREAVT